MLQVLRTSQEPALEQQSKLGYFAVHAFWRSLSRTKQDQLLQRKLQMAWPWPLVESKLTAHVCNVWFKGIWRISNNSNKDHDLERGGSFWNHLYQVVRLLIEILVKTTDAYNLIELSKCLYQKPDNDKYLNVCCSPAWASLLNDSTRFELEKKIPGWFSERISGRFELQDGLPDP